MSVTDAGRAAVSVASGAGEASCVTGADVGRSVVAGVAGGSVDCGGMVVAAGMGVSVTAGGKGSAVGSAV
jgi:hypothetical protein